MGAGIHLVVDNTRGQIEDLETEIERLREASDRCRKILVGARALVIGGGLLFLTLILGIVAFDPVLLLLGIAAVPAGIALYGSNRRTLDDLTADIADRQTRRREMIDRLDLEPVLH